MQIPTALKQSVVGLGVQFAASVQIHLLIPSREISWVPAFLSHHSNRMMGEKHLPAEPVTGCHQSSMNLQEKHHYFNRNTQES